MSTKRSKFDDLKGLYSFSFFKRFHLLNLFISSLILELIRDNVSISWPKLNFVYHWEIKRSLLPDFILVIFCRVEQHHMQSTYWEIILLVVSEPVRLHMLRQVTSGQLLVISENLLLICCWKCHSGFTVVISSNNLAWRNSAF